MLNSLLFCHDTTGDAVTRVSSRIGFHVVGLGMDNQRRSPIAENGVPVISPTHLSVDHPRFRLAVSVHGEVLHVARVVAFRIWDRRISRANELTSSYPFAAEGLRFYAQLATFQKGLYVELDKALTHSPKISSDGSLRDELDLFLLLPKFPAFLSAVEHIAPVPLAEAARRLAQSSTAGWRQAIENFWHGDSDLAARTDDPEAHTGDPSAAAYPDRLLAWVFLQPYAEYLADQREIGIVDGTPSTCPLCACKPIVGVLRSEGDGAKKSLVCMLCAHEWAFRRIYCPAWEKKENHRWRTIRRRRSLTSESTFATHAIRI